MITPMDVDHPEDDQQWDRRERGETEIERLDRNWNSLLQELRVVQTGVQLLTGFLLTLPFQQRFDILSHSMRTGVPGDGGMLGGRDGAAHRAGGHPPNAVPAPSAARCVVLAAHRCAPAPGSRCSASP